MITRCPHCMGENEVNSYDAEVTCDWCGRKFTNPECIASLLINPKDVYEDLCEGEASASRQYELRELGEAFTALGAYKDSREHAKSCFERCKTLVDQAVYEQAKIAMEKSSIYDNEIAMAKLRQLGSYKDAEQLLKNCRERIPQLEEEAEKQKKRTERAIGGIAIVCDALGALNLLGLMFSERYMVDYRTVGVIWKRKEMFYWGSYWSEVITEPQYTWIIPVFLTSMLLIILHYCFLAGNLFALKIRNIALSGIAMLAAHILLFKTIIPPAGYSEVTGNAYLFWGFSLILCLVVDFMYGCYAGLRKPEAKRVQRS